MGKILIALALFFTYSLADAKIKWAKDYKDAIEKSVKQNKPIMFIISRDTCKYCIKLENTTFQDDKIIKKLNKSFIAVRAWTNEGDFIPMYVKQLTPGLPGIWFLYPGGMPMYEPILGYVGKDKFLKILSIINTDFKEYKKEYEGKSK